MKLADVNGHEMSFLKNRNTDGRRFAGRTKTKNALLNFLKGNVGNPEQMNEQNSHDTQPGEVRVQYVGGGYAYDVAVVLVRGLLSIGCHTFNRANSQTILRWLGVTPTALAAARKVGRKANRIA
jgi:hypothetical protein